MTRLFFDIVGTDNRAFDFHGRYFRDAQEGHEHAKLLSMDLSSTHKVGAQIEVRDVSGQRLFSVPIVQVEELAPAA